jgi:uncharacterized membrane protein YeaQ/YmgE (transglycosylase-associated protein family)
MDPQTLVIWLVVGGIAGWLAGVIVKGYGYGLLGNIAIGILGSVIGGWLFGTYFVAFVGKSDEQQSVLAARSALRFRAEGRLILTEPVRNLFAVSEFYLRGPVRDHQKRNLT